MERLREQSVGAARNLLKRKGAIRFQLQLHTCQGQIQIVRRLVGNRVRKRHPRSRRVVLRQVEPG